MEILFIIMIFFIGTVFGSFFTLAVYRIPLGKNITHERSFCPNCEHRLEFKDLIPVFSYIFLKGKCRYCGEKVRPRYLILEILSGTVFVLAYISVKINILGISYLYFGINYEQTVEKLIYLLAFTCFYITNAIIIGIDKEYMQINRKVLIFGILTQILYMIYLNILGQQYNYIIYLITLIFLLISTVGGRSLRRPGKKQKLHIPKHVIFNIYNNIHRNKKFNNINTNFDFNNCFFVIEKRVAEDYDPYKKQIQNFDWFFNRNISNNNNINIKFCKKLY